MHTDLDESLPHNEEEDEFERLMGNCQSLISETKEGIDSLLLDIEQILAETET